MGVNACEVSNFESEERVGCLSIGLRESAGNAKSMDMGASGANIAHVDVWTLWAIRHATHTVGRGLCKLSQTNNSQIGLSSDTVESERELDSGIERSEIYNVVVRDCEGRQVTYISLGLVRVDEFGGEGYLLSGWCFFYLVRQVSVNLSKIRGIEAEGIRTCCSWVARQRSGETYTSNFGTGWASSAGKYIRADLAVRHALDTGYWASNIGVKHSARKWSNRRVLLDSFSYSHCVKIGNCHWWRCTSLINNFCGCWSTSEVEVKLWERQESHCMVKAN